MVSMSYEAKIGANQNSGKISHGQKWAWSFEHVPQQWELGSRAKSVLGAMEKVCAKYVEILKICR